MMKNTFFESFSKMEITQSTRVLHTPSRFAKQTLFYMQEAGALKSLKTHRCKRENLDSFLFILVVSGHGEVTIRDKSYALSPSDCVLIDCKHAYSHQSSEDDPWELMWVHFNGPQAQSYYDHFCEAVPDMIFHTDMPGSFTAPIHRIIELCSENTPLHELIVSRHITDILTLCFTEARKSAAAGKDSIAGKLSAVRDYLDEHFTEKITLDSLAEQFYISKFHLSREFKEACGITIGHYILLQRINYAKHLLRFSDKSIDEIASECGIGDTSYFNKVFKKSENMTASRYRKDWSQ